MFVDSNVNKSFYRSKDLLVRSTFSTFQGEAPFSGEPAVFIRLGGCNRGAKDVVCAIACDTDFRVEDSVYQSAEEWADVVHEKSKEFKSPPLLVITGGEPFLQSKQLVPFVKKVLHLKCFSKIQFESNGDIPPCPEMQDLLVSEHKSVFVVISPKANTKTGFRKSQAFPYDLIHAFRCVVRNDIVGPHNNIPLWVFDEKNNYTPLYLSPMTVYKGKEQFPDFLAYYAYSQRVSRTFDLGWTSLIDREATRANFVYAQKLAMEINQTRRACMLSFQSHLFFGAE